MPAVSERERRTNLRLTWGGVIAVVVGGVITVAVVRSAASDGGRVDCDDYAFDAGEWDYRANRGIEDDSRETQAEALARCDTLVGLTRSEVTEMLGRHDTRASTSTAQKWWFYAGEVNDGYGPGDGQMLYVHFDPHGRVERATLAYPQ